MQADPDTTLYVFVSFSMPEEAFLALSNEIVRVGGVMVLRGLPGNSFKNLAVKIYELKKQGLRATIQVDPRLFSKYSITTVPTFVTTKDGRYDKLSGNVSLAFALEKMGNENAQKLRKQL